MEPRAVAGIGIKHGMTGMLSTNGLPRQIKGCDTAGCYHRCIRYIVLNRPKPVGPLVAGDWFRHGLDMVYRKPCQTVLTRVKLC